MHTSLLARDRLQRAFLLVLHGADNRLMTGISTWDNRWTCPHVDRVPLYYHDPEPAPSMQPGKSCEAIYFAVGHDGWITIADTVRFVGGRQGW